MIISTPTDLREVRKYRVAAISLHSMGRPLHFEVGAIRVFHGEVYEIQSLPASSEQL